MLQRGSFARTFLILSLALDLSEETLTTETLAAVPRLRLPLEAYINGLQHYSQYVQTRSKSSITNSQRPSNRSSWCSGGIMSGDLHICCSPFCSVCGGSGCSERSIETLANPKDSSYSFRRGNIARKCCASQITRSCRTFGDVACRPPNSRGPEVGDAPRPRPLKIPPPFPPNELLPKGAPRVLLTCWVFGSDIWRRPLTPLFFKVNIVFKISFDNAHLFPGASCARLISPFALFFFFSGSRSAGAVQTWSFWANLHRCRCGSSLPNGYCPPTCKCLKFHGSRYVHPS